MRETNNRKTHTLDFYLQEDAMANFSLKQFSQKDSTGTVKQVDGDDDDDNNVDDC